MPGRQPFCGEGKPALREMCECRSPSRERDKPGLLRQRLLHQGGPVAGADDGDVVVEVVARVVHGAAAGAAIGAIADPDVAAGPGLQHVGEVFRPHQRVGRSEERRVGKEWDSTCRSRWSANRYTKTTLYM